MSRSFPAVLAALALALFCGCGDPVPAQPRPTPAVKLKLLQAPQASLDGWSGLRGKLVVLEFWATWCDSCLEAQPHLNELAAQFKDRPVQFLFVTADAEKEVRRFLKTHRLSGWIGLDPDGSACEAFGVHGLPHTVVLDARGNVLGETYPEMLTADRLEAMLLGTKPAGS